MGKIKLIQSPYRIKIPWQEGNLLRIWNDKKEPPRKYIWEREGIYYIWCRGSWIFLDLYLNAPNVDCSCKKSEEQTEDTLEEFRKDIMNQVSKYVSGYSSKTQDIDNRVAALENIDHSQFITDDDLDEYATKTYVNDQIQEVTNEELENRMTDLENSMSNYATLSELSANYYKKGAVINQFVSKSELEQSVENAGFLKADANTISDINNSIDAVSSRVTTLENKEDKDTVYDDTAIRLSISNLQRDLSNNISSTENALAGINTRVTSLENLPHDDYITSEEVQNKTNDV